MGPLPSLPGNENPALDPVQCSRLSTTTIFHHTVTPTTVYVCEPIAIVRSFVPCGRL